MRSLFVFLVLISSQVLAQSESSSLSVPGFLPAQDDPKVSPEETERALLRELKALIPDENAELKTRQLIKHFSNPDFTIRNSASKELKSYTEISIRVLKAEANSDNLETRYRVKDILNHPPVVRLIYEHRERIARIIKLMKQQDARKMRGLLPVIFESSPFFDSDELVNVAGELVAKLVNKEDLKTLREAFRSEHSQTRRLSIYGLGKIGDESELTLLRSELENTDENVVLCVVLALTRRAETAGLSKLVDLLDHEEQAVRVRCIQILRACTGINKGLNPYLSPADQKTELKEWKHWLQSDVLTFRLKTDFQIDALPEDIEFGLVVHYEFDKADELKFTSSTGNEHRGETQNSVDWINRGTGKAIRFHGAGQHGSKGGHALISPVDFDSMEQFTLALWVNETGLTHDEGEAYVTFGTDGGVGLSESLGIAHFNGMIYYRTGNGMVGVKHDERDRGKWTHYAMSFKNGLIFAYRNGEQVGNAPGKVNIKTTRAALGRHWWGNGGTSTRLQAAIDDVRIYNRYLDSKQIAYLVKATAE